MPVSTHPRVLAVRFSSIGDILLTTPLLRALRRRYPEGRITVVTRDYSLFESPVAVDYYTSE